MRKKSAGILPLILIIMSTFILGENAIAQDKNLVVRVAKLQIDSAQLENYLVAAKEEITTAIHTEPGVLTLYAVQEKEHPANITIFEIYANAEAYKSHLQTPHFKKYKLVTKDMVKSLELMDTVPVALESKFKP